LDSSNLVKKLEQVSSLSNIVGISLVDGIKVSGIDIGDSVKIEEVRQEKNEIIFYVSMMKAST
jgi:hypothetical protein